MVDFPTPTALATVRTAQIPARSSKYPATSKLPQLPMQRSVIPAHHAQRSVTGEDGARDEAPAARTAATPTSSRRLEPLCFTSRTLP